MSCFLWFHKWSKWSALKVYDAPNNIYYQTRLCEKCGKAELNEP